MDRNSARAKKGKIGASKRSFINDEIFKPYTEPRMVDAARAMLSDEAITEEGFLGAQAVLLLNGLL